MKKRLLGLVALTLCAMLALAPASAALADWFYDSEHTAPNMLRQGDLIEAGTTIYSGYESGRDHFLAYYNGIASFSAEPDEKVVVASESSAELAQAGELAGFESGVWASTNERGVTARLERLGEIVHSVELPNDELLIVSSGLQNADGYDMSQFYPEERKQSLEDAAKDWDSEAQVDLYQMMVYVKNHPVQGVMRPVVPSNDLQYELTTPATVILPYPEGWNQNNADADSFVLIHGRIVADPYSGAYSLETERLPVTPVADGLQAQVSSFSPYGLAYKVAPAADPIPDPEPTPEPVSTVPTTGDNTQLALWFLLAALSLAGAAILIRRRNA